jgi:hypothetical protein
MFAPLASSLLALLGCQGATIGIDTETASETGDTGGIGDTVDTDPGTDTGETGDSDTKSPSVPDPFEASWLWATLNFDDAKWMGFEPGPVPAAEQIAAGAVTLAEVAEDVGLGDSVTGGNTHGVGIGFFDFDGDGWEDIFVASGIDNNGSPVYPSSLWRNQGDGTFVDVSAASGIRAALSGLDTYSVAAADYDGDGDLDVHITAHPTDILLQNQGDGTFVDVSAAAGLGGPESEPASNGSSKIGAWGDYDGDGWLDLAVASSQFLDQPAHGYLMRNRGDGTFEDVTARTGFEVSSTGNPCAVLWTDYDNDGDQDLWVWNDRGSSGSNRSLLRNSGGQFSEAREDVGATNSMGNPMGIDGVDLNRDGWLDYYIGNIGGNALLLSVGDGTFVDYAASAGVQGEYSWGLGFEDLNHDSWTDIFVAEEDDRPYLTFTNLGQIPPKFAEQHWDHVETPDGDSHNVAVAFADYDHDGDVDMVTAGTGGVRMNLFRNDTDPGTNRWLHVTVPVTPGTGEKGGVSGRVAVKTGDLVQWRDLQAGSSRASMNALSVRFGLGQYTGADWVAVLWPDGRMLAVYGVEGNQVLALK